jgi:hypothetical protein
MRFTRHLCFYSFIFFLSSLLFPLTNVSAATFTRSVFLQNVSTSSIDFRWVTDTQEPLIVKYGTSSSYGSQVSSDTVSGTGGNNNHAKISGLPANTRYYYQITTASGAALTPAGDQTYTFKTAPTNGSTTPFSFAIWGDSGVNNSTQDAVSNQVTAYKPDLAIIAGDIAYPYSTSFDNNNSKYFNHYKTSMRFAPYYVTCGNHESSCSTAMSDHSLPQNGNAAGQSTYSFDYGNVHFVSLNSNGSYSYNASSPSNSDPQIRWAYNDIKNSSQTWKVVYWHHNAWSAGSHSDISEIINNLAKMSEDAGADFAIWGHSHVYERFSQFNGTYFFTIGDGGKSDSLSSCGQHTNGPKCLAGSGFASPTVSGTTISKAGFLWMQVNGNQITSNYVGSSGKIEDKITVTAKTGGPTNPPVTNTPTQIPVSATSTPRPTSTGTIGGSRPGDANADGKVDGVDFVIWMNHYGQSISGVSNGDFNTDGRVDGVDYVIWFQNYNGGTNGTTPTPSSTGSFSGISQGQTISGDIFVTYNSNPSTTTSVSFFFDSSSTPYRVEKTAPYALNGNLEDANQTINAYDTHQLANAGHLLSVSVLHTDGTTSTDSVAFLVNNVGSSTATSTPRPTNTQGGSTPTPSGPTPTQPAGGTSSLTDCTKYGGPKRLFLETQAWWMDTKSIGTSEQLPLKGIGGHAHTATCFPQDQQISGGTLHFDVRLMLHKGNTGHVQWLDIGLGPDGQSLARVNLPNLTCDGGSDPKKQCEWWIPIDLDTSKVPSGYQELRFRFNVIHPNGERMFASTGWQAWYHGGTSHYRTPPYVEARGWFETTAYENARVTTALPYSPVSGTYTFKAHMAPGSGGKAVATHGVHVDAKFNLDDFGHQYVQGNGSYDGNVSIDTTQLTNGPHCVALRTSSIDVGGGTNTGVFQFPIVVNNPGGTAGNGKGGCQPGT